MFNFINKFRLIILSLCISLLTQTQSSAAIAPIPMTINITIPAASATKDFKIGLSVIDGTVNWGDGTSDTYSGTSRPTHTYSASGSYSISVTGTATSYTSTFFAGKRHSIRGITFSKPIYQLMTYNFELS